MVTKKELNQIWRDLQERISAEQVFALSVILAFFQYLGDGKEIGEISREALEERLLAISDGETAEAAKRLIDRIDWSGMKEEVRQLAEAEAKRFRWLQNREVSFREVFSWILELENRNGEYAPTPPEVRKLIVNLMGKQKVDSLADFCCGGAVLGLELWEKLTENGQAVYFRGEELRRHLCDGARLNLWNCGVPRGEIRERDLLAEPDDWRTDTYDVIVMDIPRGRNVTETYRSGDPRLRAFDKRSVYSDWIFIQDALLHLKGTAAVLATPSALIRMNEEILRQEAVEMDLVEAVFSLPANLYSKHYTGTELLIFNRKKSAERRGKILFVDIRNEFIRDGQRVCLSEEGISLAGKIFTGFEEIEGVSAVCSIGEVRKNVYTLKPIQYLHLEEKQRETETLKDVAEIVRGAQIQKKEEMECEDGVYFLNIKDIQENRIHFENADRIVKNSSFCKEKYRIQEDDILLTSKGTAIKMAVVEPSPSETYISGNLTRIRVNKERYDPYVLFEYLNSQEGRIALACIQSGATIQILNNRNLGELKIPKRDISQMRDVGEQLKRNAAEFYRKREALEKQFQIERVQLIKELEGTE